MAFLIALVVSAVLAVLLAKLIKAAAWVFYVLALAASAVYAYCWFTGKLLVMPRFFLIGMRSCLIGAACMVVVMYVGALPDGWLRRRLAPIRGELSIIGAFFCVGHMATFLTSYVSFSGITAVGRVIPPLVAAFLLLVLLIVLTATSFNAVKRAMSAKVWKGVQRWAYVFYGVLFFHVLWFTVPRAFTGNAEHIISAIVYVAVFAVYVVMRALKAKRDKMAKGE